MSIGARWTRVTAARIGGEVVERGAGSGHDVEATTVQWTHVEESMIAWVLHLLANPRMEASATPMAGSR